LQKLSAGKLNPLCPRGKIAYNVAVSRPRVIALLLAFLTLAAYLPTTQFEFINYDDNEYLTANPIVQSGLAWAGVQWAFTTGHASNWHPVTWLSHMVDVSLFGMNPGAHHFVNALFHAANAALLFALLWRLFGKLWPCAVIAALFAWHPLRVESVAWVAERKDVLSTFFALLTLLAYVKSVRSDEGCVNGQVGVSPSTRHASRSYWLAFLFLALGLMSKPMLVTLPCVMLLLDFWPLRRFQVSGFRFQVFTEKIPFFALVVVSCGLTFVVQHRGQAVATLDQIPLWFRLENAPVAAVRYLLKIFCPTDLAIIYPIATVPLREFLAATATLLLVSGLAWRGRKVRPYFLLGWLWFLGTLMPVIGLVQVGSAALADRYTYLPGIGILIALIFSAWELVEKFPRRKIIFAALTVLVLAACLGLTQRQLTYWQNSETLFRRAVAVTQNNDLAHINLGAALDAQGRADEAFAEYRAAAAANPGRTQVHFNLGLAHRRHNRHAEALAEFREAARLDPTAANARSAAGSELIELGKPDAALAELAAASRLNPNYAVPHLETARLFFQQGRDAEAVDKLRAALRAEPDNFEILNAAAHYLAVNENSEARDGRNALVLALKANELTGHNHPDVFDVLGMALAETGDYTNAVTCAENALELARLGKMKNMEPIAQRLALYKNHQPWRENFRATNAAVAPR
jgi:protein O-mannosyl-transferase